MKTKSEPSIIWTSRLFLAGMAGALIWLWADAEFGMKRGDAIAGLHDHLFFLGEASVCFFGLVYSFIPVRRASSVAGVSLLLASAGVWFSVLLMLHGIAPPWIWIALSTVWFALPIMLATVLFGAVADIYFPRLRLFIGISVALAVTALIVGWRPFMISLHKIPLAEEDVWYAHMKGLNRFRLDAMLWALAGGSPHDLFEEVEYHREALVGMGYFQVMDFSLHQGGLKDVLARADHSQFADSLWVIEENSNKTSFKLTAYVGDMTRWQALIKAAGGEKSRQNGATNAVPLHK